MLKEEVLNHDFKLGNRLHKTESMPYWCKITIVDNKLLGIDGNGEERIIWTPNSFKIFKGNGIYRIAFPIWCYSCNDYADVFCTEFHDFGNGRADIECHIDDYYNLKQTYHD